MSKRANVEALPGYWPVLTMHGGSCSDKVQLLNRLEQEFEKQSLRVCALSATDFAGEVTAMGLECLVLQAESLKTADRDEICPSIARQIQSCLDSYDLVILVFQGSEPDGSISFGACATPSVVTSFDREAGNVHQVAGDIAAWLTEIIHQWPVWACVLIGGASRRMGQPKHLLQVQSGMTWLEKTVHELGQVTAGVVLSGQGDIPESLSAITRLTDVSDSRGPLAGVLSAMRWNTNVGWVVVACDMPEIDNRGLQWLLNSRRPGIWGCIPRNPQTDQQEPLLAYYDFRSRTFFEEMVRMGTKRIGRVSEREKIAVVDIPDHLVSSWANCNTMDDVKRLRRKR